MRWLAWSKQGILRREEKRLFQETIEHLWIFRSPRYFSVDGKSQHNVRTRFAHAAKCKSRWIRSR